MCDCDFYTPGIQSILDSITNDENVKFEFMRLFNASLKGDADCLLTLADIIYTGILNNRPLFNRDVTIKDRKDTIIYFMTKVFNLNFMDYKFYKVFYKCFIYMIDKQILTDKVDIKVDQIVLNCVDTSDRSMYSFVMNDIATDDD